VSKTTKAEGKPAQETPLEENIYVYFDLGQHVDFCLINDCDRVAGLALRIFLCIVQVVTPVNVVHNRVGHPTEPATLPYQNA
jgi:hypothetical protein